jgi:hypothetical protein
VSCFFKWALAAIECCGSHQRPDEASATVAVESLLDARDVAKLKFKQANGKGWGWVAQLMQGVADCSAELKGVVRVELGAALLVSLLQRTI